MKVPAAKVERRCVVRRSSVSCVVRLTPRRVPPVGMVRMVRLRCVWRRVKIVRRGHRIKHDPKIHGFVRFGHDEWGQIAYTVACFMMHFRSPVAAR